MSTLLLIRHGQASFGAEDYDVLSERGREQSLKLGAHFAANSHRFDAVYVGPRKRHRDTAEHLTAAAREGGLELPEPLYLDELDEYPAFELFRHWLPRLVRDEPEIADLASRAFSTPAAADRLLSLVTAKWMRGELTTDHLESFDHFVARVNRALDTIMAEQGRQKNIAVVTSGGPVSMAVRRALRLADEVALQVTWTLNNASLTEFRYRDDQLSLVRMNTIPHLREPTLVTLR